MCAANEVAVGPWELHSATWLVLMSFLNAALYFSSFSFLVIFIFIMMCQSFSRSSLAKLRSSKCCRRSVSAVKQKNDGAKWGKNVKKNLFNEHSV